MPVFTIYALGASQISVSGGQQLSGITQGSGIHLNGQTITLNANAWESVAINDTDTNFNDSDNSQSLDAAQSFDGTAYAGGLRVEAEYQLTLQDPDGNSYTVLGFNINEPGAPNTYGTVEGLAFVGGVGGFPPIGVPLTVVASQEGPSQPYVNLATPPCFVAGSLIETPSGLVAVESLAVGDLVTTLDHGPQELRWIGKVHFPAAVLEQDRRFRPVRLRRDALGPGCPLRDSFVSQQHRILISDWRAMLYFGEEDILVPARKLVNDHSICVDHSERLVTYVHLLFDQHEIVRVDGLLSESYLPHPDCHTENEFALFFPEHSTHIPSIRAARPCIQDRRAYVLG